MVAALGRSGRVGDGPGPGPWFWSCGTAAGPSRIVTWLGAVTWPGATSANSSSRLLGFCTMPVTCQVWPSACQTPPTLVLKTDATWLVSATWPGPFG